MLEIVLASKSKVREEILKNNGIKCLVMPSSVDEEPVKKSLINEGATPEIISKNLAELKANKVSQKNFDILNCKRYANMGAEGCSASATPIWGPKAARQALQRSRG